MKTSISIDFFIKNFGANVKKYRLLRGWSQSQLAERLHSTKQWISAIEQGKLSAKLETVKKIALTLEIDPKDLLDEVPNL